jgi:hypothetical protein
VTLKCNRCSTVKPYTDEFFRSVRGNKVITCRKCDSNRQMEYCKKPGVRGQHLLNQRMSNLRLKIQVFTHYSVVGKPECGCCGIVKVEFLTIDHIDGGGTKHRQSLGARASGSYFYRWLRDHGYPTGYRVLCFNCNCGINANDGVCPHKQRNKLLKLL